MLLLKPFIYKTTYDFIRNTSLLGYPLDGVRIDLLLPSAYLNPYLSLANDVMTYVSRFEGFSFVFNKILPFR